ncbi:MAG: ABC transporter ATP-binding protein [Phycisphaerae bacterium]
MLEIRDLETGYGKKQVVFGLSLTVRQGEIVALIGPNGAGKSTVLKSVCGVLPVWRGNVLLDGSSIMGATTAQTVAKGVAFAPQGNRVFGNLTVLENLAIGGHGLPKRELSERTQSMLEFFPLLKNRARNGAAQLSGGERQMLALARALMPKPRLLLLDEPSLGLSPSLVKAVFHKVSEINRETGVAVLIVEQKVREVLGIAGRVYGMRLGRMAISDTSEKMFAGDTLKQLFLG